VGLTAQELAVTPEPPAVGPAPAEDADSVEGAPTISLSEALAVAFRGNFGLLSSVDGVESARLGVSVSEAQFFPQLTPTLRGDADDRLAALEIAQKLPWTGGTLRGTTSYRSTTREDQLFPSTSDVRLTLSQPLLRGFGPKVTKYDLDNSRRGLEGRERSFEREQQRLAVDVTAAFFQVIRQRQLVAVARQSQERSLRLKIASEARLEVGLASKMDVLRAELQTSQAESAAVAAESALETALEQFRLLLGLAPTDPVEPENVDLPTDIAAETEPLEVLLGRAAQNRVDLAESLDQVADAERKLAVSRNRLLPQVDVNMSFIRTGYGNDFTNSWESGEYDFRLYFTAAYPLDRSSDSAARANAELELAARQRLLTQKRFEIEGDVRSAVRDLQRIQKSVDLQRKNVEFADQQHRLATLRYERGLASNFDVVDAEGNLFSARTTLVGLLADYQVARAKLQRATGDLDLFQETSP
jgi:outer membrane protein